MGAPRVHKTQNGNLVLRLAYEIEVRGSLLHMFCLSGKGGKGAADRMAATAKNHIRMYINEGNDVTNAHQMKDALLSHGGVEGVRVAVADSLEDSVSGELPKIAGISKLNNFRFTGGELIA